MRDLVRPVRFLAVAAGLLLLWLAGLRDAYATAAGALFAGLARMAGAAVAFEGVHGGDVCFSWGETSWIDGFGMTGVNLVPFVALVLATGRVSWGRRMRMLALGGAALVATHLGGFGIDLLHASARASGSGMALAEGLRGFWTGVGTFFFPLLIWLVMVRDRLPLDRGRTERRRAPGRRRRPASW